MHTILSRALVVSAVASLVLVSGCGDDDDSASDSNGDTTSDTSTADDAMADLVGSGCADYAERVPSGAGSIDGMTEDKVAEAASNNPLLTTLVDAVSGQLNPEVNLVDTLNGAEFTVFAPVDDAFAALPKSTVESLAKPSGAETLTSVLTYHVVSGQLAPDQVVGTHETVQTEEVEVSGSGDSLMVNDAGVICGGVQTANATVYLIDAVLMPPSMM